MASTNRKETESNRSIKELLLESLNDPRESLLLSAEDWEHADIGALILEHAKKLSHGDVESKL